MKFFKQSMLALSIGSAALVSIGCSDADIASRNLSKSAEYFEIDRRIVFYNGITGEYVLSVEGRCSVAASSLTLAVTCKTGVDEFKKHYLGLSDNVTYFSEQLASSNVSAYHYRVVFKPQTILPNLDLKTSKESLNELIYK